MKYGFPSRSRRPARVAVALPVLTAMLALSGCASAPPPNDAMNQAQMQLQAAREAGARDYDPVDLDFAQNRYRMAENAMASRHYEDAASLAAEAAADAELARVKARLGAARAQIQSKTQENARLRAQAEQPVDTGQDQAPAQQVPGLPPAAAPTDMPAPPASLLAPPPAQGQGQGFQSLPQSQNQGDQP